MLYVFLESWRHNAVASHPTTTTIHTTISSVHSTWFVPAPPTRIIPAGNTTGKETREVGTSTDQAALVVLRHGHHTNNPPCFLTHCLLPHTPAESRTPLDLVCSPFGRLGRVMAQHAPGCVPLHDLVARTCDDAFAHLHDLTHELASAGAHVSPDARRRALLAYVRRTRHQLVQLLVATRWAQHTPRVQAADRALAALNTRCVRVCGWVCGWVCRWVVACCVWGGTTVVCMCVLYVCVLCVCVYVSVCVVCLHGDVATTRGVAGSPTRVTPVVLSSIADRPRCTSPCKPFVFCSTQTSPLPPPHGTICRLRRTR